MVPTLGPPARSLTLGEGSFASVNGSPVRYWKKGSGKNVLLLHGGGLDSASLSWGPVWPHLGALGTFCAPDLPGFGETPLGSTPPTLEGYASWLAAFMTACEIQSALLVGLSLGGGIALQTALDSPSRVTSLILYAPYGVSAEVPGGKLGYWSVHVPGIAPLTMTSLRNSNWAVRKSLESLVHDPTSLTDELVGEVRALTKDPSAGRAWAAFQSREVTKSGLRTDLSNELHRLTCPALLCSGEYDRLVPAHDVQAAAARMPNGTFESIPRAAHWVPRDAPSTVAEHIESALGHL